MKKGAKFSMGIVNICQEQANRIVEGRTNGERGNHRTLPGGEGCERSMSLKRTYLISPPPPQTANTFSNITCDVVTIYLYTLKSYV